MAWDVVCVCFCDAAFYDSFCNAGVVFTQPTMYPQSGDNNPIDSHRNTILLDTGTASEEFLDALTLAAKGMTAQKQVDW